MENNRGFLDIFIFDDVKNEIVQIVKVSEEISQKKPVSGFHHNFYVPGWIGFFQMMFVESKMGKFAKESFYDGKNYYEFADWIINSSKKVASLQLSHKTEVTKEDKELYQLQTDAIIRVFNVITNAWIACCPEVATYCNLTYTNDTTISPAGMVLKGLETNLKDIGYAQSSNQNRRPDSSFKADAKGFLYQITGYIINVIVLAIIFGIIRSIFG